jgi:hypothetical protein
MDPTFPKSLCDSNFSDARHQEIVDRLEESKASGLIADYFVSWIGTDGELSPNIRAWKNPDVSENRARDHIRAVLMGIIDPTDLIMMDTDRAPANEQVEVLQDSGAL